LVNIHITWHFFPPVSVVKDAMESVYMYIPIEKTKFVFSDLIKS